MITDLAAWRARLSPYRAAAFYKGRWFTYTDMNQRAERLAARLAERGVGRGSRVGILAHNHIAHLDLILAAPKLGFVYTPFNYRLADQEQNELVDYVRPSLVFHDGPNQSQARGLHVPTIPLDGYENWLLQAPSRPEAEPVGESDLHMLLFTGGSTGLPKAAMIPYRQTFANAANTVLAWGLNASHCVIQATPCFHAAVNAFATPLLWVGGRVVIMETFEPQAYLEMTEQLAVTQWFLVPTMYQMLAEHPKFAEARVSTVQWAISGGAPCPPRIAQIFRARGIRFRQGYGMTEAGVNCFAISLEDAERNPDAVGYPMPGLQAVIRNANGHPVPSGETGELTLRGPAVSDGYYERPDETAQSFSAGWLWTGDLATCDERGLHRIVGRRKEMFISGGENVYPVEVETALYACEEVAECAVMGVPHPRWGEVGLAAISIRAGRHTDETELTARLREKLAAYKVPRAFLFVETMPKTGAGKIDKPALRARYLQLVQQAERA